MAVRLPEVWNAATRIAGLEKAFRAIAVCRSSEGRIIEAIFDSSGQCLRHLVGDRCRQQLAVIRCGSCYCFGLGRVKRERVDVRMGYKTSAV